MNMLVNQETLNFITSQEGLKLTAYKDGAGVPTIGVGHTEGVHMGMAITVTQAYNFLKADAQNAANQLLAVVTVPLTDNQLTALISFVFNLGIGNFKSSTLLKKLNAKDYAGAADQFKVWNLVYNPVTKKKEPSPGIIARRNREATLFMTP